MFRSIRWRLPLTYAAIALIAALALGAVLLITLRDYYAREEAAYLRSNARAIGSQLVESLSRAAPPAVLQSQLDNFAFLSQVQLRVLNATGEVVAASSITSTVDILVAPTFFTGFPAQPDPRMVIFVGGAMSGSTGIRVPLPYEPPVPPPPPSSMVTFTTEIVDGRPLSQTRALVVSSSPFGFAFDAAIAVEPRRSDQQVREPLIAESGQLLGYLEVFDGPAYGSDIVDSVAQGWLMAGSVAVIVAAVVGWFISRRLTQPVLALTAVTQRMAAGDLAPRAQVASRDEFGALARSFNDMADRMETTIVTLRHFIADAAHELHTPLTALQTDLELSAAEPDSARRAALIAQAQQQSVRLRELADNLLDLSRVEASGAQRVQTPLNLNALLRDLSEPYASQADQAGLTLLLDLPPEPIEIRGDPAQLSRAIGNLIDNAIKFTPEGGTVTLELRRDGDQIELCVADTGIGIPADDLPLLFSRFHRGRNAAAYPGSGLGLAIVKAIVEAHGGQVTAQTLAQGARFCLRWPSLPRREDVIY